MVLNLLFLTSCSCTATNILRSFPLLTFFLLKFMGCLSCQKLWKWIQDTFTSTGLQLPKYFPLTSTLCDYGRLNTHKAPSLCLCSGRDIRILCLRKAWLSASHEKKILKRRVKYVATSNSEAAAVKSWWTGSRITSNVERSVTEPAHAFLQMCPGTGGTVNVRVPYSVVVSHTGQLTSEKSKKKEAVTGAEGTSCSAWRPALFMSAAIMLRKCLTTAARRNFVWIVQCATCTQNVFLITASTSLSCKIGVVVGADGKVSLRTALLQGPHAYTRL